MIRVLLADDHGVIRDGLGRLIGGLEDVELVGTAADGADAIEKAKQLQPDVVVMDLDMPRVDGIEATRKILAQQQTNVLVLTAFSDRAAHPRRARGRRVRLPAQGRRLRGRRRGHPRRRPRRVPAGPARRAHGALSARSRARPARRPLPARARSARRARRRPPEQADRAPAGDQREDRQVAPDARLPRARRDRPHAGRAVGGAPRSGPKVSLSPGPRRWHRARSHAAPPPAVARPAARGLRQRRPGRRRVPHARSAQPTGSEIEATVRVDRARGLARRRRPRGPRRLARHASRPVHLHPPDEGLQRPGPSDRAGHRDRAERSARKPIRFTSSCI